MNVTTAAEPIVNASVIVNYFNPRANASLRQTLLYALECLAHTTERSSCEIICADGSGIGCDQVAKFCGERNIIYAPAERAEMFAETYNRGCQLATGNVFVLCASDIFVTADWLKDLLGHLDRTGAAMRRRRRLPPGTR